MKCPYDRQVMTPDEPLINVCLRVVATLDLVAEMGSFKDLRPRGGMQSGGFGIKPGKQTCR